MLGEIVRRQAMKKIFRQFLKVIWYTFWAVFLLVNALILFAPLIVDLLRTGPYL